MSNSTFSYPEEVLHWIWKELLFSRKGLQTNCGKSIQILHPGWQNNSDGPDFLSSKLIIGNMQWNGAVEIHTRASDWFAHKHHLDSNYNNVVLHVVADNTAAQAVCQNSSKPFTLNILPYLDKGIHNYIQAHYKNDTLPCINNLKYLSESVIIKLINNAHQAYLEKKVDDFYSFYDANKIPSEAWKFALIKAVFDGFGISNNRHNMQNLADLITSDKTKLHELTKSQNPSYFIDYALKTAFDTRYNINWKHKANRPFNHPEYRIRQAAALSYCIINTPFDKFIKIDALNLWNKWCTTLNFRNTGRIKILYGTVFIPAINALASLFAHTKLSGEALLAWNTLKCPIPKSIIKPLDTLGLKQTNYKNKLGSVHFIKSFCRHNNCSKCNALNNTL